MPLPTANDLRKLAARAALLRQRLLATGKTQRPGQAALKFRSRHRSHERIGISPWQPGSGRPMLKPLAMRDALVVREYQEVAEIRVDVLLDYSRSLLDDPQAGGFAVGLAFCVAAFGAAAGHPTRLALVGSAAREAVANSASGVGRFVQLLSGVKPTGLPATEGALRLRRALRSPYTNRNYFAVWHCGYPLTVFEAMVHALAGHGTLATVFIPFSTSEFDPLGAIATDPETGRRVEVSGGVRTLADYLYAATRYGWSRGVRVEPLVVEDAERDLETVLLDLARM